MASIVKKLLNNIQEYNIKSNVSVDLRLVKNAIKFIKEQHKDQFRYSGLPYYTHPVEVANIVIDYVCDTQTIIAALLHDAVEDTDFSINQIDFLFESEVALMIDQLTKLDLNHRVKLKLSKEENLCKLLNIIEKKVLVIKLSDRLHNMRTLKYINSIEKRKKIALETLQVFVPIAKYLDISKIEYELLQLAILVLNQ